MTTRPKAKPITCQSAFRRMTRPCLASVRRHHAAACRGDAEAVHQIRIALTRFRAARKFFAAMTRDAAWPKLEAAIDWLDSALGAARDSDVATGYAKTKLRDHLDAQDGADLARQVRQTHRRLASVLRSKRCDNLIAALEQWIDNGPWRTAGSASEEKRRNQPLADYAPDRLRQWKHRLARKSVGSLGKERWRHRLRIAAKRYRYMREALAAIGLPERRTGLRERVAAQSVQKALGDLRDLQRFRKVRFRSVGAKFYRRRKKQLLHKAKDALRQFA